MLLIYANGQAWQGLSKAELETGYKAYMDFTQELMASGAMRGGSELAQVSTATTVRGRNGKALNTDGPFVETTEQLGGYYNVEVPNLDEALKWAAKCPGVWHGSIEVRPLVDYPA